MSLVYELGSNMTRIDGDSSPEGEGAYVMVMSKDEFEGYQDVSDLIRDQMDSLLESESCYADILPDCIIGSVAVPNKDDLMGDRDLFSFYCDRSHVIYVDEGSLCAKVVEAAARSDLSRDCTTYSFLYVFWLLLTENDATWLGDLEDKMEDAEEGMLSDDSGEISSPMEISSFRRTAIRFSAYYQQLAAMALIISGNEWGQLNEGEVNNFNLIVNRADRLAARAETIREYSLQLRELHQTQLDMKQNYTMQILTIVTVLLAPLTLLAGWFGMNFTYMPGIGETWGFAAISIAGLAITILLILWFRKKNWL